MKPKRLCRGFTMIEILVSIAIIAVLGVLIFLVTNRAKQSATAAKTLNNLREIGACSGLWMSENNNYFPPTWDNTNGANRSYAQVLDPYMHGAPTYRKLDSKFIGPDKRLTVKVNDFSHPITYTMNRAVCRDLTSNGRPGESLVHASKVANPSHVILMADGCQNPSNLGQTNASAYRLFAVTGQTGPLSKASQAIPVGPDTDTSAGDGWFRYPGGKAPALMCDGSAKSFAKGTILFRNIWINTVVD
jgi:prepilin-type N-terminal cleavage/methylation domain-containing protein